MNGKITFFFLIALCATQGIQARSVQPETYSWFDDLVQKLAKIRDAIKTEIPELIKKINDFIQNFQDKIKNIKENIEKAIKDALNKIIADKEILEKCFAAEKPELDKLTTNVQNKLQECQTKIVDETKSVGDNLNAVLQDAKLIVDTVRQAVKKCWNGDETYSFKTCLEKQFEIVQGQIKTVAKDVKDTVEAAKVTVTKVQGIVEDCSKDSQQIIQAGQEVIMQDMQKCVKDNASSM